MCGELFTCGIQTLMGTSKLFWTKLNQSIINILYGTQYTFNIMDTAN